MSTWEKKLLYLLPVVPESRRKINPLLVKRDCVKSPFYSGAEYCVGKFERVKAFVLVDFRDADGSDGVPSPLIIVALRL